METEEQVEEIQQEIQQEKSRARPVIDHMLDAVVPDGLGGVKFLLNVGDEVIIERNITCLASKPWLDTWTYRVMDVNRETGNLKLYNINLEQQALSNYVVGSDLGYRFKIPSRLPPRSATIKSASKSSEDSPTMKAPSIPKSGCLVYRTKGRIHVRIKKVAYMAPESTRAKVSDRINFDPTTQTATDLNEVWKKDNDF